MSASTGAGGRVARFRARINGTGIGPDGKIECDLCLRRYWPHEGSECPGICTPCGPPRAVDDGEDDL